MKKTARNLMILAMVFSMVLVISNAITAKTIQTGIPLFGSTILIPAAVVCYPLTFLVTDIVGEIWGRKESRTIVLIGFGCQVGATVLIVIGGLLPAGDESMQGAYSMVLGQNYVFVIASMTAYLLSQSWDVFVFHKIRNRFLARGSHAVKHRWIWNNVSTMSSQAIDTVVFIGIAFGVGMGWLFDPVLMPQVFAMMVGQYVIKLILAAIDTPFFYFFTRGSGKRLHDAADAELPDAVGVDARGVA